MNFGGGASVYSRVLADDSEGDDEASVRVSRGVPPAGAFGGDVGRGGTHATGVRKASSPAQRDGAFKWHTQRGFLECRAPFTQQQQQQWEQVSPGGLR